MTTATEAQASLWDTPDTVRRRQPPRPARTSCALCGAPPATPLGLCRECLAAAATEHAIVTPPADRRLAAVPYHALCQRCGRSGHDARSCEA